MEKRKRKERKIAILMLVRRHEKKGGEVEKQTVREGEGATPMSPRVMTKEEIIRRERKRRKRKQLCTRRAGRTRRMPHLSMRLEIVKRGKEADELLRCIGEGGGKNV